MRLPGDLCNFSHGANARFWQWSTFLVQMIDNVLNDLAQFTVEAYRILPMNSRDEIRALCDVHLIFIAPFNPFVVSVKVFHFCTESIA